MWKPQESTDDEVNTPHPQQIISKPVGSVWSYRDQTLTPTQPQAAQLTEATGFH